MSLTEFQRQLLRLIASNRKASGESYVAGGVALNSWLQAHRISRDIDLFHDTDEALRVSWELDRGVLVANGFRVDTVREAPAFVEAIVIGPTDDRMLVQWVRDSAYRFFPLLEMPAHDQPSDHLALAARFAWRRVGEESA